jgi:hypothetical protein
VEGCIIDDLEVVIVCVSHVAVSAIDKFVLFSELLGLFALEVLQGLVDSNTEYLAPSAGTAGGVVAVRDVRIWLRCR